MAELRAEHLGGPPVPRPVRARLKAAYEEAAARG
jgi:hypothetical protein